VGASTGGLDALRELLGSLGRCERFAIVFVQHVDPSSQPLLSQLLGEATEMEVIDVTSRTVLKSGCLYVAPARQFLEIKNGAVHPVIPDSDQSPLTAVDHFFQSLAEDQAAHAVGVVLSGAGSDGTVGLKAISDKGGLTFAQDSESAKIDSMPRSAATAGVADHVCRPSEIAAELIRYADHVDQYGSDDEVERVRKQIGEAIPRITEHLLQITGHNFQHYKITTLMRRIKRRMQILKIATASEYLVRMQGDDEEAHALFRELLIAVTAFFRDPEAFDALARTILPKIFQDKNPGEVVRIWVAGCSTGEEAYSLAMMCREHADTMDSAPEVQIFATDIDERALGLAREGSYPSGIEDHVNKQRLKRFFVKRGKRYQVSKEIRERVLFSKHNLIGDPPFSRLDLISCRNLLIYMGAHLQEKLIPLFHYSLRPSGFLFLGPSETISTHGELFRALDNKFRISQRKGTAAGSVGTLTLRDGEAKSIRAGVAQPDAVVDLSQIRQRILLDEFAPKAVVIDQTGQVLNASDGISKYLAVSGGDFHNNIVKMALPGLRIGLRAAINEATKSRRKITHDNLSIRDDELIQRVMLTVQPMPQLGEGEELFLVVFHDVGEPMRRDDTLDLPGTASTGDQDADAIIAQMERELETTRSDLERTLQDMEAANEEMKSSNEELLSMNEELQSANEELEASKEEIRAGSEAVARANADLENLLRSTQIATVFLDAEMNIRSFTPAITRIYGLLRTDVGRPLEQIVPAVDQMPPLPDLKLLQEAGSVEHTVRAKSGKHYIRRVRPYQSHGGVSDGVVVTFVDVSDIVERETMLASLMSSTAEGIYGIDLDGNCTFANPACARLLGYESPTDFLGKQMHRLIHHTRADGSEYPNDQCHIYQAYRSGQPKHTDDEVFWRADGTSFPAEYWSHPQIRDGQTVGCVVTFLDITERKQFERERKDREEQLRRVIDNQLGMVGVLDLDGTLVDANAAAIQGAGLTRDDVIGNKFWDCYWWNYDDTVVQRLRRQIAKALTGQIVRYDEVVRMAADTRVTIDFMISPVRDSDGRITHLIPSAVDISDRKRAEEEVRQREQGLQLALDSGAMGLWEWDIVADQIKWSDQMYSMFGYTREGFEPNRAGFLEVVHPDDREMLERMIRSAFEGTCQSHEVEFRVTRGTDKSIVWTISRGTIRRDVHGRPLSMISVAVDVTERKKWETELVEREAHLRRVINNQLGLVGVIDRDGILLDVDDRSLAIAQTRREDVVGKHFANAPWWNYDSDVVDQMREAMRRAFTGEVVRFDISLFAHGDEGVMIDFMIAPVMDENGQIEYLIPSGVDIRDRKMLEQRHKDTATRLEAIFNTAVDGIITIDPMGVINSANAAASRIFGYTVDEMLGSNVKMLMPEPDHSSHDEYLRVFEQTGQRHIIGNQRKVMGRRKDGSTFPLDLAVSETTLSGDHRFVGILRDITDRVLSEKAIKDASRRMKMALRAGGMAAWEWTPEESYWTKEVYDLLGVSSSLTANPELFFSRVHPSDLDALKAAWQEAVDGKNSYECEFRIMRPDGQIRWLVGQGEVVRDRGGQVTRIYGLNWDSTNEHLHEEALRQSEKAAKAASASKSAFLANMSHEIRTPMTAILGYVDLLAEHVSGQQSRSYIQTIRRNGNFLLEIINDILDLSKIEAGKLEVERQRFSLPRLIEDVRSIMSVRAAEKNLSLDVDYRGNVPPAIESDPKRLKQVLINLVGNAIKFTETGKVTLVVSYESDNDGRKCMLRLDVVDTGIGISEDHVDKLFQPFSQADASVSRNFGGTGLGLAISHRLAEALGGDIAVESTPSEGSQFSLRIDPGEIDETKLIKPGPMATGTANEHDTPDIKLSCHILVVDDRRDIRFLSKHILSQAGGKVEEAENGQEAVDRIREQVRGNQLPDIILLDMQMPKLDGYQTAKQLRELGFTGPIIALTADAMQGDMNRCIQAGCNDYLSKPIDKGKMLRMVAEMTNAASARHDQSQST
ncbi:MAG: PAS domain S-box protein, partial [Planctomycetales bacterium]|nr:PAS domain S-box protein [Planctomycetales bacterium]